MGVNTEDKLLSTTELMEEGVGLANPILGGSRITADGDCSHDIKRCLLLGIKVMTNLDSSTLAWKIPWMEEPGELQSMGSQGVGHD